MENLDEFFSRAYVIFPLDKVMVFPKKIGIHTPDIWTIEEARQYIKYLENERIEM